MNAIARRVVSFCTLFWVSVVPAGSALAVNLVPNASFETYASCPSGFGQIYQAVPWNTPTAGTSDHYHACAPLGFPSVNVPQNTFGFQTAHTGSGYAGCIVQQVNDYREYIEAPLSAPLAASATYTVEFWVSLSDTCNAAIDRLGAYLSVGPVGPFAYDTPLPYTPQVESPAAVFLTDTVNWMKISGTFVAVGGEDHIVIGNFHDNSTTSVVPAAGTWPGTNYYIDDLTVELYTPVDQACCLPDGTCTIATADECTNLFGGTPQGPGTLCDAGVPCGGPTVSAPGGETIPSSWGAVKSTYR